VVQVTINRPDKLNCIDKTTSREIAKIWELFDEDESLWVAIITGVGRAFCTGADLGGGYMISKSIREKKPPKERRGKKKRANTNPTQNGTL
jgi:enoyl-CoA hydratase/carnithine racemase